MLKPLFRPPRNIGGKHPHLSFISVLIRISLIDIRKLSSQYILNILGGSVAPGSQELTRRTRDRSPRHSMVSNNELRQTVRGTLGVGGNTIVHIETICYDNAIFYVLSRNLPIILDIYYSKIMILLGGNGTPDSSRFSISGQTGNQLPPSYIRNGGSSDTPGIMQL